MQKFTFFVLFYPRLIFFSRNSEQHRFRLMSISHARLPLLVALDGVINTNRAQLMHKLAFIMFASILNSKLRVVQTKVILFLESMSERGGSDIERLWIWMISYLQSILSRRSSFNFRTVVCQIRPFTTLISKIKWIGSGLPLNEFNIFC